MKNNGRYLLIVLILASLLMCAGCSSGSTKTADESSGNAASGAVTEQATGDSSADAVTEEQPEVSNQDVQVKTSYGELYYPYGFEEIVNYEQEESGDAESYVFYAVLENSRVKVYTITFSNTGLSDRGDLLGTVADDSGKTVNVYLLPEDEIVNDSMSDEDKDTVYTAQETLNDVVNSLHDWNSFTAPAE